MSTAKWTLEAEGRGRRSVVHSARNEGDVFRTGELVDCDDFVGGIVAFKRGESDGSHEVQLLQFVKRDGELLATSLVKWYGLDVLENKLEKSDLQISRAIDHHRHHKEKIESLPESLKIETPADLLDLSKHVASIFTRPATPRKRSSPAKRRSEPKAEAEKDEVADLNLERKLSPALAAEDSSDDESFEDEEEELVPRRKRKQKNTKTIVSRLAAATLDSPSSNRSDRSIDVTQEQFRQPNVEDIPEKTVVEQSGMGESAEASDIDEEEDTKLISSSRGVVKQLPFVAVPRLEPSIVDRAIAELHPASDPPTHLCRDEQFDQIFIALESAISAMTGTCIYVSGTPGTGKTSVIREVIGQLDLRVREEELTPFTFLEINGMKLVHPSSAYEHLWEVLGRGQMAASNAMTALEAAFSVDEPVSERGVIVLLLDEMDQLVTKGQQLMYNFFNWPSLPHSRLIVIAVANTMDLPERILSNKISSRVGLTRIQFPGYTHAQLKEILMQRLGTEYSPLVEDEAVEYAARKVAGVGGDARRVLDFVRQAMVLASNADKPENGLPVKTWHVRDVIVDSQKSPVATFIKTLGLATKVLLCAILARIRRTSNIETPLHDVLKQAAQFVKSSADSDRLSTYLYPGKTARLAFFQPAVMELVESGMLVQQAIKGEATPRVRLMVPVTVIREQLEFDPEVKGMI